MSPMVKRIAKRVGNGGGPGLKFCEWIRFARAKFFGDTIGTHGAPFVMIAFKPDFEQVIELAIFRDVARREMAMIVKDGLFLGKSVIKTFGGTSLEEKI